MLPRSNPKACLFLFIISVLAASDQLDGQETEVQVLAQGLNNPCAVTFDQQTNTIFVSESGSGRILSVDGSRAKTTTTISDFKIETYGSNPSYRIGPLALAITPDRHLLVGEGGQGPGDDRIMTFPIEDRPESISADDCVSSVRLLKTKSAPGEGNFYGLVSLNDQVFTTCHGDDSKGWIARAKLKDGQLTDFKRFTATSELVTTHAPTAITADAQNHLWVSQYGETNVKHDGVLLKIDVSGKLLGKYYTGLNDITGIAIHPKSKSVFVTDFSWIDESAGGLFKLSDFESSAATCKATKVLELDRPTALAFDQSGTLWVTEFGKSDGGQNNGRLLKISGL